VAIAVGVVGTGVMGADHIRTLVEAVPGAEVIAVADPDQARALKAAQAAGGARVHTEPRELIGSAAVNAVVIASPDETHEPLVLACLEAGKPVFCEKPLAATAAACLRVVDAEVARGRRLVQLGFMRRFDPGYQGMKRTLESGTIGRPLFLHCVHRNREAPPWFTSAMLFSDSAVHEIDLARWLLGRELTSATVHTPRSSSQAHPGLRDPRFIVLRNADDVIIDVETFVSARYGYDIRCELVGERGTVALPAPPSVTSWAAGAERREVPGDWRERFAGAYAAELRAWVAGTEAGEVGGPSAWDGYAAQVVAEACLEATVTGQTIPVSLPSPPPLYR
jgi:myo-inositol 2-dehydrogenase/D-chiro-inositol 1-dehydrogenase